MTDDTSKGMNILKKQMLRRADQLRARIDELEEENARLRQALTILAADENWYGESDGDVTAWQGENEPFDIARAALGSDPEKAEAPDLIEAQAAEIARLREVLQLMDDTIIARSELFVSDQECLFNLRDRIRHALNEKGPTN